MENLGVYVHIPFCKKKCAYCDFYSLPCPQDGQMDAYLAALQQQIGEFFVGGPQPVDTIYIGGGTPSIFGEKRLCALLKTLRKRCKIARNPEITVEVNPESVSKSLLKSLKKAGVNRISMGIQSADDTQLKDLGRLHTFAEAKAAAALIHRYCTDNISVDLMYGLPGQTMESWQHSVEEILALEPKHISCYSLKLEEGTPLFARKPELPDGDAQADLYLWMVRRLAAAGFAQYEISNFGRHGFYSRHNQKYWDLRPYVGFGCGAHSFYGGKRFSITANVEQYIASMNGQGSVIEDADELSFVNRSGEYLMLGLRTVKGVEESEFYHRFHQDFTPYAKQLEQYLAPGYVLRDGDRWYLTPKGFLVSNLIIGETLDSVCHGVEVEV